MPKTDVMTADELARRLRISRRRLYDRIRANEIPGRIKLTRGRGKNTRREVYRFSRAAIERWLGTGAA